MKTKGVNTSEQIDELLRGSDCPQTRTELYFKRMIISCFTYGQLNGSYVDDYKKKLDIDVFNDVYNEQVRFLEDNYRVEHNVYTDSEGLTYNQLKLK